MAFSWIVRMLAPLALALFSGVAAAQEQAPAAAGFLVAKPGLPDPNFHDTVVLVVPEDNGGHLGVIINRPLPLTLKQALPEEQELAHVTTPLYFGGPVARTSVVFVFRSPNAREGARHLFDDIYLSASLEVLQNLLKRPNPTQDLRVFAGYAGWGEGQLLFEIARDSWFVTAPEGKFIFTTEPGSVWPELVNRLTQLRALGPGEHAAKLCNSASTQNMRSLC